MSAGAEAKDASTAPAPVTDVHAHAIIAGLEDSVQQRAPEQFALAAQLDLTRNGSESAAVSGAMVGSRIPKLTSLGTRIADMDAQGVDLQWVSPSPNHYYPWADEDLAVWIAREANLRISDLVAEAPDRLLGLGLVPLQHPERIVECVDDAVLGRGLIGIEIPSFAGDVELSDGRLEPFWARMEALGAVVFVHPFGCSLDERLDRFYLSNTVGQPVETATALSHLIFAGVLDRHPRLKVVAAHGGGYLPTTIGRSDHAWNVREDAHGCAEEPSSYLNRIWYDTVVHDARQLRHLIEVVGADRVLLGSDYPFDMGLDDPAREVAGMLSTEGFDTEVSDALLRSNAAAMLRPTTVSGQERTRQ
ncbi:amidohydrolase family protein [Brevibacterium sp. UCMA 11754]|uniref:amidohydrolase family protein n=1 Tax=Brevibacterium sp. UCMA 11754 TaxID=2749198 RepID=UPI001F2A3199|nr:amidohydrolase family protein [Brevibacterium sp. UCMA 11754]MCF2570614.1 amidohydrolase [Brevibacterium sp. UCMA 11754]